MGDHLGIGIDRGGGHSGGGELSLYDGAIQAESGMMAVTGHPTTGPTRAGYFAVDMATGITAAYAVATALFQRTRTGAGRRIDVPMLDTAIALQAPNLFSYMYEGGAPRLTGNRSYAMLPTDDSFPTRDGHIQVTGFTDDQVEAVAMSTAKYPARVGPVSGWPVTDIMPDSAWIAPS